MAGNAAKAGSSLKRRSPGGQARASRGVNTLKKGHEMDTSIAAANVIPATVDFHGYALTVITGPTGERLVAMKPICEAIGLGWKGQHERIYRDDVLKEGVRVIRIPSAGGEQDTLCLPLDLINGWLFGIDVGRCKEEIRPTLIQYKRECYAALAAYWQQGEAVNLRKPRKPKELPNGLTLEQQDTIKALVKARVEALPKEKQAKAAVTCWSALKSKFGCSYKKIEPEQFTEAVSLVARVVLEGEWLGKEEKSAFAITEPQLAQIGSLLHSVAWVWHRWSQGISQGVAALNPGLYAVTRGHVEEMARLGRVLDRDLSDLLASSELYFRLGGMRPQEGKVAF